MILFYGAKGYFNRCYFMWFLVDNLVYITYGFIGFLCRLIVSMKINCL